METLVSAAAKGGYCLNWMCAGARFGDGSVLLGRPESQRDGDVVQAIIPPGVNLPEGPDGELSRVGWRLATWKIRDEDGAGYGLFMPERSPDGVLNWGHDVHRVILWFSHLAPNSLNWFVARLTDAAQVSLMLDSPQRRAAFASGLRDYVQDVALVQVTAAAEPELAEEPIERLIEKLDPAGSVGGARPARADKERRLVAHT